MSFYDYHLHSENFNETIEIAKKLGFGGLCFVLNWSNHKDLEAFKKVSKTKGLDIVVGVELHEKAYNVKKVAKKIRKDVEIILVHGGDYDVNRAAVETPEVDILLHPEMDRDDSGFDHVMAKLAKENNVAIDFALNDVIYSYKKSRVKILAHLMKNAKIVKKYKTPFVLTSGGYSTWDLRSPSEILSFGKILGFESSNIKKALSGWIVKENRKRLKKGWIQPGVEVLEKV